jgi:pyrimidine deaminase RibD-like protein
MECQIELNKARCTCTYEPCSRKGKCCECIAYHLEQDELPGCVFPAETEKIYDRSITRFVEVFAHKAGGGRKG